MHRTKCQNTFLPRNLGTPYTQDTYQDEGRRLLEKQLPYLNLDTGLKNRMLLSDPITGLGDLSMEVNPINGCHLERKQTAHRDPVRMEGDLGKEYNCMYTTKETPVRPREERDPILLKGNLGTELDAFRPNGGLPRHRVSAPGPKRDPIVGDGDSGLESGPKSVGRSNVINQSWDGTNPITHSLSRTGVRRSSTTRQYNELYVKRNPILHIYNDQSDPSAQSKHTGMRHFPSPQRTINPITHVPYKYILPSGSQKNNDSSQTLSNSANSIRSDASDRSHHVRAKGVYNRDNVQRNPITGEGMKPTDYSDLLRMPRAYPFRHQQAESKRSLSADRPTLASTAKQRTRENKSARYSKSKAETPPPPEKKVIRPKRVSKPATPDVQIPNPTDKKEETDKHTPDLQSEKNHTPQEVTSKELDNPTSSVIEDSLETKTEAYTPEQDLRQEQTDAISLDITQSPCDKDDAVISSATIGDDEGNTLSTDIRSEANSKTENVLEEAEETPEASAQLQSNESVDE